MCVRCVERKSIDRVLWYCHTFRQALRLHEACIDRFQVSHFRPVVMEIEIGGRSDKSLGGQESAAVDQECMRSNASSCSFGLSFHIIHIQLSFFFFFFFCHEPVSCRGQRIAPSNGKRNRTVELMFTKNITRSPYILKTMIAIRSICVHHTVPEHIDQKEWFGLQSTAKKKKKKVITSWKIVMQAHTNQPIKRFAWHRSCA